MKSTKSQIKKSIETLPVKLTDDELLLRAKAMAAKSSEIEAADVAESFRRKEVKGDIEKLDEEHARLRRIVASGKEHRKVECETHPDVTDKTMITIRLDTGEVSSTRAMTAAELKDALQSKLDLIETVERNQVPKPGKLRPVPDEAKSEDAGQSA